jgi:hypothetical protein
MTCISTIRLLAAKYSANACSATASEELAGQLHTATFCFLQASRAIVLYPMPMTAIKTKLGHCRITSDDMGTRVVMIIVASFTRSRTWESVVLEYSE